MDPKVKRLKTIKYLQIVYCWDGPKGAKRGKTRLIKKKAGNFPWIPHVVDTTTVNLS
jgi:hypothetical protein